MPDDILELFPSDHGDRAAVVDEYGGVGQLPVNEPARAMADDCLEETNGVPAATPAGGRPRLPSTGSDSLPRPSFPTSPRGSLMPTCHKIMTTEPSALTTAAEDRDGMAKKFHEQEVAYKRDVRSVAGRLLPVGA